MVLLLQKMIRRMRYVALILFLISGALLPAQTSELNKGNGILLNFTFSGQLSGADLAQRFGPSLSVGSGADWLTEKQNFLFGLEGYYFFGEEVKQDVLALLRTPEGEIIGNDRSYADIQLRQRGFYLGALVGKLFSISAKNPRAGLRAALGAGLLQHKIRIQDDPFRAVPQLTGDYKKGYDRLSNGLALRQQVGYQVLSTDRRVNFYIGLECTQGFTRSRRDFNFDTRSQDTTRRLDLQYGVRLAWVLPFYVGKTAGEIYY